MSLEYAVSLGELVSLRGRQIIPGGFRSPERWRNEAVVLRSFVRLSRKMSRLQLKKTGHDVAK